MKKDTYIIFADTGEFWTGQSWASEYPEAHVFDSLWSARLELLRPELSKVRHVVLNYGMADEEILLTYPTP